MSENPVINEKEAAPKPKKATAAEIDKRVDHVMGMLIGSAPRAEIVRYGSENWQVTDRQIDDYIAAARTNLKESAAYDRDEELALAIAQLKTVIYKAAKMMDFQRVLAARRELNQLLGLYAPPAKQTLQIEGLDLFALLSDKASAAGIDMKALLSAMIEQVEGVKHE